MNYESFSIGVDGEVVTSDKLIIPSALGVVGEGVRAQRIDIPKMELIPLLEKIVKASTWQGDMPEPVSEALQVEPAVIFGAHKYASTLDVTLPSMLEMFGTLGKGDFVSLATCDGDKWLIVKSAGPASAALSRHYEKSAEALMEEWLIETDRPYVPRRATLHYAEYLKAYEWMQLAAHQSRTAVAANIAKTLDAKLIGTSFDCPRNFVMKTKGKIITCRNACGTRGFAVLTTKTDTLVVGHDDDADDWCTADVEGVPMPDEAHIVNRLTEIFRWSP